MKKERAKTIAGAAVLFIVGVGIMLYPTATEAGYKWAQWRLATAAQAATVSPEAQLAGGIALPDGAVARIEIPAIGVDAYVVEGTGSVALAQGPGHYPETPLPGRDGNSAIAGHRTMYGHVFHDLHELEAGDEIVTYTSETRATYRILEIVVVDPSEVDVVAPTDEPRLTLTTCHPIGSAAQRLVVVAELQSYGG
jgi:sortase A